MMVDFVSAATAYPTAVYTTLLVVVLVYWIVAIIGIVDFESSHADLHVDMHADMHMDMHVDFHHHGHLGHTGTIAGAVVALGLTGVPFSVVISILVLLSWISSCLAGMWLLPLVPTWILEGVAATGVLIGSFVFSLPLTALMIKPLRGLFVTHHAISNASLVGHTCRVITQAVDEGFGRAEVDRRGANLNIRVWAKTPNSLSRGCYARIVDYNSENNSFLIEAQAEAAHPPAPSPNAPNVSADGGVPNALGGVLRSGAGRVVEHLRTDMEDPTGTPSSGSRLGLSLSDSLKSEDSSIDSSVSSAMRWVAYGLGAAAIGLAVAFWATGAATLVPLAIGSTLFSLVAAAWAVKSDATKRNGRGVPFGDPGSLGLTEAQLDACDQALETVASELDGAGQTRLRLLKTRWLDVAQISMRTPQNGGPLTLEDRLYITECMRRYLPDTLSAFLSVPADQRRPAPPSEPQPHAVQLLYEQLVVLEQGLEERLKKSRSHSTEALARQHRFLKAKHPEQHPPPGHHPRLEPAHKKPSKP